MGPLVSLPSRASARGWEIGTWGPVDSEETCARAHASARQIQYWATQESGRDGLKKGDSAQSRFFFFFFSILHFFYILYFHFEFQIQTCGKPTLRL